MHCTGVSATPKGDASAESRRPARVALHHREGHILLLGPGVQASAHGFDAIAGHVLVVAEQIFQILGSRHHVEGRVQREHDDLDLRLIAGQKRHFGIVGGKADVPDLARSQKFAHVFDEGAVHDGAELVAGVHVVDHAQFDVIGAQALQQVLEGRAHLVQLAGTHVLAVLPGTADVALDDPLIARRLQGLAEGRTHRRVAHPAVHDVHAGRGAPGGHGVHLGLLHLADPLGAEPDNTRLQARAAQFPILHGTPLFFANPMLPRRSSSIILPYRDLLIPRFPH